MIGEAIGSGRHQWVLWLPRLPPIGVHRTGALATRYPGRAQGAVGGETRARQLIAQAGHVGWDHFGPGLEPWRAQVGPGVGVRCGNANVILGDSGELRDAVPYFSEPGAIRGKQQVAFHDDDFLTSIRCRQSSAPERKIYTFRAFMNLGAPVAVGNSDRWRNIAARDTDVKV